MLGDGTSCCKNERNRKRFFTFRKKREEKDKVRKCRGFHITFRIKRNSSEAGKVIMEI